MALTIACAPVTTSAAEAVGAALKIGGIGASIAQSALYSEVAFNASSEAARRANERILAKGAATSLDHSNWRNQLRTAVKLNPGAPQAFIYKSRSYAPWDWATGPAPPNVTNVEEAPKLRSISVLLGQGGYEYSAASQSVLKVDKNAVLRSVFQLYRWEESRWLSWIRESRLVLALAEFRHLIPIIGSDGKEAMPIPGAGASTDASHDILSVVKALPAAAALVKTGTLTLGKAWPMFVALHTVDRTATLAANPLAIVVGSGGKALRRDSLGGGAPPAVAETRPSDESYSMALRVIYRDSIEWWATNDFKDESDADVIVSRAGTYSEVVADFWGALVEAARQEVSGTASQVRVTILVPKLNAPKVAVDAVWANLPVNKFVDWTLASVLLAGQNLLGVGRAASMPSTSHSPITGRDLFSLLNYLTVARVRDVVPVEDDTTFHVGACRSSVWDSPVSVRLAAAVGWLNEATPPHGLSSCYVPTGPQLDRMMRFQAVRLGWGFDYLRGCTISDGRLVSYLQGAGHTLFALNRLLFNLCYGTVDGVLVGWTMDWDAVTDPTYSPVSEGVAVGVRRRWLEIGLPVNASDEWDVPGGNGNTISAHLGPGARRVTASDSSDSSRQIRAALLCDATHKWQSCFNVEDVYGDSERWGVSLHGIKPRAGTEIGLHWFSVPAALLRRRSGYVGVARLPELCSDWWPDAGLWVVAGTTLPLTGVAPRDVNSAGLEDF